LRILVEQGHVCSAALSAARIAVTADAGNR
jgi:hypothetical protein